MGNLTQYPLTIVSALAFYFHCLRVLTSPSTHPSYRILTIEMVHQEDKHYKNRKSWVRLVVLHREKLLSNFPRRFQMTVQEWCSDACVGRQTKGKYRYTTWTSKLWPDQSTSAKTCSQSGSTHHLRYSQVYCTAACPFFFNIFPDSFFSLVSIKQALSGRALVNITL